MTRKIVERTGGQNESVMSHQKEEGEEWALFYVSAFFSFFFLQIFVDTAYRWRYLSYYLSIRVLFLKIHVAF